MQSTDRVAFFGLEGDVYSEIALEHLRLEFSVVHAFLGTSEVPPRAPDPGKLDADWLFCFKSKTIFRQNTLDTLCKGAINFHTASPKYPGSGGVNLALYNGDKTSAVTVHRMNAGVDAGTILDVMTFPCHEDDDVASLIERTYRHHLLTFLKVTSRIAKEGLDWVTTAEAFYKGPTWGPRTYRMRDIEQLKRINPSMSPVEIARRIRATRYKQYSPYIEIAGNCFTLSP